ncbi:hypothetical protein [Streptomyces sp. NPDC058751]|uniref:hypothetical protein n=1 Tax=Streptomyces sp. NPDC058751 TaxID=3346623 RepID=UPI00369F1BEC
MEPQRNWISLGLERRRPTAADWTIASTLGFLLHLQPHVPELAAPARLRPVRPIMRGPD